jgi:uncharacterized protein YbcV (DUF1398 family)
VIISPNKRNLSVFQIGYTDPTSSIWLWKSTIFLLFAKSLILTTFRVENPGLGVFYFQLNLRARILLYFELVNITFFIESVVETDSVKLHESYEIIC